MEILDRIDLIRNLAKARLAREIALKRLPDNMTIEVDAVPAAKNRNELGARMRTQLRISKREVKSHFVIHWTADVTRTLRPSSAVNGFFGTLLQQQKGTNDGRRPEKPAGEETCAVERQHA
jgi:hypothetical protein